MLACFPIIILTFQHPYFLFFRMELNQQPDFSLINANEGAINGQQNGQVAGTSTSSTPQMSVILTIRLLMQSKVSSTMNLMKYENGNI